MGEPIDGRKQNKGRPPKLNERDKRRLLQMINILREREGWFSSSRLAVEAGVARKVHTRTVRLFLNKSGFYYLQARKKGWLTAGDIQKRFEFAKMLRRYRLSFNFWTRGIAFYLDGKGFAWKSNPLDQARAPRARIWRKRNEGLELGCTAKAGKAGVTNVNFMVAISWTHGVVLCEHYEGNITGQKFADIVTQHFPGAFERSIDPRGRRILQDGCPRQNSAAARNAIYEVNGKIFKIPPRSPDLNPIENLFHNITRKLRRDALTNNITKETREEFAERVQRTMREYDTGAIDKLIESMPGRIDAVYKGRGKS